MKNSTFSTKIQEMNIIDLKTRNNTIILPKDLVIAGLHAESIIEEAEIKAAQILENAQLQSDKLFVEAQEFGYQKGLEKAAALIYQANQYNTQIISQSEMNIIDLSVDIAQKIIKKQLELHPDTIVHIAKECLKIFFDQNRIDIKLNKDNIENINSNINELKQVISFPQALNTVVDDNVHPDSCLVITPIGKIDMNINTQLNVLKNILSRSISNEIGRKE